MKKITVIITGFLILSTVVLHPALSSESVLLESERAKEMLHQQNLDEIKTIYENVVHKIDTGKDPTREVKQLLGFEEVQSILSCIADNRSVDRINILFSNKPPVIKNLLLTNDFLQDTTKESEQYTQMKTIFDEALSSEIHSIEDIYRLEIVQSLNLSRDQISELYNHWESFLSKHPSIASMFDIDESDLFILVLIIFTCLVIYILIFNGLVAAVFTDVILVYYQLGVGVVEAVLFGIAMSGLIVEIRPRVLGNRSIVSWIAEEILFKFFPFLSLYEEGVKTMISSTFAIVLLAGFMAAYLYMPFVTFFAGGLFSVALPLIVSAAIFYLFKLFDNKTYGGIEKHQGITISYLSYD
jgi:hypothetical protein